MNKVLNDIINNRSGYYFKNNNLKNNYPDLFSLIENHCKDMPQNLSIKEKTYLYYYNINKRPLCKTCNTPTHIKDSFKRGFSKYCSVKCMNSNKNRKELIKNNLLEKYGVESHNQLLDVKNKKINTYMKKYGVDNPMKSDSVLKNRKSLFLEKYGVDNPMKVDSVINKIKENVQNINEYNVKKTFERIPNNYKIKEKIGHDWTLIHKDCDLEFTINSNLLCSRLRLSNLICTNCNPINSKSSLHLEIKKFIDDLNIEYSECDRSLIKPYEVDLFIPSKNIGIEINGLFWHSDVYKDQNYHNNKLNSCNKIGIDLIQIFEDEWYEKKEIVESIIKSKIGFYNKKIYARKCEINFIDNKIASDFIEKNHIQGSGSIAKYSIGLYYNDELISVMTFGKKRKSMGNNHKNNHYEMYRFCNKLNTTIVGGMSKLLKFFEKEINPEEIITYADRRYFNGFSYQEIGFKFLKVTKPNYWYVYNNKRFYRYKFRKDMLVKEGYDPNLTEKEIMKIRGYNRIYDCGSNKFIKTY